ncbi:uncharacterized protein LOC129222819 [Uloborus diversus]|uniref:uncharacterized protein LOC129222819 n=1 Tax=Uloborus diversus TaxID=327109 RepID=UPI0024094E4E|nr:uncharacterized protein LOC129222819 [Uloborus diversus]
MKAAGCLFCACLIFLVLLHTVRSKTCFREDECREDECCMTKSLMIGGCREKISQGHPCIPNTGKSHLGDMYLMSCPCIEGYECIPEKVIENDVDMSVEYYNSTCQKSDTAESLNVKLLQLQNRVPKFLRRIQETV